MVRTSDREQWMNGKLCKGRDIYFSEIDPPREGSGHRVPLFIISTVSSSSPSIVHSGQSSPLCLGQAGRQAGNVL